MQHGYTVRSMSLPDVVESLSSEGIDSMVNHILKVHLRDTRCNLYTLLLSDNKVHKTQKIINI